MREHLGGRSRWHLAVGTALLVIIVAAVSIAIGGSAAAARGTPAAPSLAVTSHNPFTVRGRHFKPHVRVQVRLMAAHNYSRRAVPDAAGAFILKFSAVVDRCTAWSVSASQRGQVVLVRGPKPECAPASTS